jgi:hypothetical protein
LKAGEYKTLAPKQKKTKDSSSCRSEAYLSWLRVKKKNHFGHQPVCCAIMLSALLCSTASHGGQQAHHDRIGGAAGHGISPSLAHAVDITLDSG